MSSDEAAGTDALQNLFDRGRAPVDVDMHRALANTEARLFARQTPPPSLGRYVLLTRIGMGGQGIVHEAYDPELDRKVAIKLIMGQDAPRDDALAREARAASRVAHDNIVAVHDVGRYDSLDLSDEGQHRQEVPREGVFLVMELLTGGDLAAWIERDKPTWTQIVDRFIAVAEGLAAAHDRGVVHLDFKPQNVLLSAAGTPKIVDFGLARLHHGADDSSTRGGTAPYMAPEQHDSEASPGPEADQYAFCVALYEALGGQRPFAEARGYALYEAKVAGAPKLAARVPERLRRALRRGLSPDPARRFPSMHAVVDELRASRRRRGPTLALTIAVIGAGAASVLASERDPCAAIDGELDDVWNPERRERLHARLSEASESFAGTVATTVVDELDAHRDAWLDSRRRACVDAHADGRADAPNASLCLQSARSGFAEVVAILEQAGPDAVSRAHRILDALPRPQICDSADPGAPSSASSEDVLEVERLITQARSLGTRPESVEAAERAVARAEAIGDPTLRARAAIEHGAALVAVAELERAAEVLELAVLDAERAGDDATAVLALAELAYCRGWEQHRFPDARRAIGLAQAKVDRADLGWWPRARIALVEGAVDVRQGAVVQAATSLGHARELLTQHLGSEHPSLDRVDRIETIGWFMAGRTDVAAQISERRAARLRQRLGADHPETLGVEGNLAVFAKMDGRYREALTILLRVTPAQQRVLEEDNHSALTSRHQLATVLEIFGRFDDAAAMAQSVLDSRIRTLDADDADIMTSHVILGAVLLAGGRLPEAAPHVRRAVQMLEAHHPESSRTAYIHVTAADLETALGHWDAAAEHLKQAEGGEAPPQQRWWTARAKASLLCAQGRYDEGVAVARAQQSSEAVAEPYAVARLDLVLAQCLAGQGDAEGAAAAAKVGVQRLQAGGVDGVWLDRLQRIASG